MTFTDTKTPIDRPYKMNVDRAVMKLYDAAEEARMRGSHTEGAGFEEVADWLSLEFNLESS